MPTNLLKNLLVTTTILSTFTTAPLLAKDNTLDNLVQAKFQATYAGNCGTLENMGDSGIVAPQVFELGFTYDYEEPDAPKRPYHVYAFDCFMGAYNFGSVFFGVDEYDEIFALQFAFPDFDIVYADPDTAEVVEEITLTGYISRPGLFNYNYDPETQTLFSFSKWRGFGDASASGEWVFEQGTFVLVNFDVDATYDGERNPVRLFGEGQPLGDD